MNPKNWTVESGSIGPGVRAYRRIGHGTTPELQLRVQTTGGARLSGRPRRAARPGAPAQPFTASDPTLDSEVEAGQLNDEVADATRIAEYETKIAALERKVGQLTMEVDLLKKGARWARRPNVESSSIVSGPRPSPSREDAES